MEKLKNPEEVLRENKKILQDAIDGKKLNRWSIYLRRHELWKLIRENPDKWEKSKQRIDDEVDFALDSL